MADKERLVNFRLLGQDYSFYTGASEEELQKILDLVKGLLGEDRGGGRGTIAVHKTAILACLNIASRHIRLEQEFDDHLRRSHARATRLADKIQAALEAEKTGEDV